MSTLLRLLGLGAVAYSGAKVYEATTGKSILDIGVDPEIPAQSPDAGPLDTETGRINLDIPITPTVQEMRQSRAQGSGATVEFVKGLYGQKIARWDKTQLSYPDQAQWEPDIVTTGDIPFDRLEVQLGELNTPGRQISADPRGAILNMKLMGVPNDATVRARSIRVMDPAGRVWEAQQAGEAQQQPFQQQSFFDKSLRTRGFLTRRCDLGVQCKVVSGQLLVSAELPFPRRGRFCFVPGEYDVEIVLAMSGSSNLFQVIRGTAKAPGTTGVNVGATAILIGDERRFAFFDQCTGEFLKPTDTAQGWELLPGTLPEKGDTLPVPVRQEAGEQTPAIDLMSAVITTGAMSPKELAHNLFLLATTKVWGKKIMSGEFFTDSAMNTLHKWGVFQELRQRFELYIQAAATHGASSKCIEKAQQLLSEGDSAAAIQLLNASVQNQVICDEQ